jgi:class 3 adenylate cyclase
LQATAQSGEIVVTAELAESAERAGELTECRISERFEAVLKGVDAAIRVARILADAERA